VIPFVTAESETDLYDDTNRSDMTRHVVPAAVAIIAPSGA
jgi:hypothetical protein